MKKTSSSILQGVIVLFAMLVLTFCTFVLPAGIMSDNTGYYRPILLGLYLPAIPFLIAVYQAVKLIHAINTNKVFSSVSVQALKSIKYCGIAVCVFFTVCMPYIFYVAQLDDAPGVALIGFVFLFGSLVVATAAALFQNLLQHVLDIKAENELTV